MTWWLWVWSLVEATFLSGIFSPLTSAEACEKSSRWLWKEKLCLYWCEKARKHICFTDCHDMTLTVKVVLNPNIHTVEYICQNKSWPFVTQSLLLMTLRKKAFKKNVGKKKKKCWNRQYSPLFTRLLLFPNQISILGHSYFVVCK